MSFLASIGKAVGKMLLNALKRLAQKIAMDFLTGSKEKKESMLKWLCIIGVLCLGFGYCVVEFLIGPMIHVEEAMGEFFTFVGYSEEDMEETVRDAGKLADFMEEHPDFVLTEENAFLMDRKTVIRVLRAVAEYNKKMEASRVILYECRKDKAPLEDIDPITGGYEGEDEDREDAGSEMYMEMPVGTPAEPSEEVDEDELPDNWDSVFLSTKGIDNAPDATGEDIFYLNWQPVLVLCSMYIQEHTENIGSFSEVDADGESYYMSNAEIESVIDLIRYDYTYYQDYAQTNTWKLDFDYIYKRPSGYRLEVTETGKGLLKKRTIKRIPAIAPKKISNSYVTYEYVYEKLPNGYRKLKERTYILNGAGFVTACRELMPSFDIDLFVKKLSYLPYTQEKVAFYEEKVVPQTKGGGIEQGITSDPEECPAIGVVVSNPTKIEDGFFEAYIYGSKPINWDAAVMEWNGETYTVPLYPIDGWGGIYITPGEWIVTEGKSYGNFQVYAEAMDSLTVSDGFTLEELEKLFLSDKFSSDCPLFASDRARKDTAKCFYDYQQSTGTSVCGLLGIMRQEGGFTSSIARNGWNFFNIKASSGQPTTSYTKSGGTVVNTEFRNYKATYQYNGAGTYSTPAVNALSAQMNWINRNYWEKGQNSYYLMVWNGYDVSNPAQAYEGISHSYCPPWDDRAMPYSKDSYRLVNGSPVYYWKDAGVGHTGWINKCAFYRHDYYSYVKGGD